MTIEEAIKELIDASHREAKYGDTNNHYYEIMMRIEAFDIAIKVLEQQPSEDCISREEAIGIVARIKEMHIDDREQYPINYGTICDIDLALQRLPSVTPSYNSVKTELKPCEDCISRAKALEMLGDEPENWTDTEKEIQEVNDYRWFKTILEELPSVTPTITDVENNYNIGYNCGYADAMIDIEESEDE